MNEVINEGKYFEWRRLLRGDPRLTNINICFEDYSKRELKELGQDIGNKTTQTRWECFSIADNTQWRRLVRGDPRLTDFKVYFPADEYDERSILELKELGQDIGNSTQLRKLEIDGNGDDYCDEGGVKRGWRKLCEGINQNRSIKTIVLSHSGELIGEIFQFLAPFLKNNKNLQCITVTDCGSIGLEDMRRIAAPLVERGRRLKELCLTNCIHDDSMGELVKVFRENPKLTPKKLDLGFNGFDQDGFNSIASLLQDPRCKMEELDLYNNECVDYDIDGEIDETSYIALANALVRNTTLKELDLAENEILSIGVKAFSQCLCNTTNINTTYNSNHTLQVLKLQYCGEENYDDDDVEEYINDFGLPQSSIDQSIGWNANENKKMVARKKVFMTHFIQNFKMEPFEGMDPELLVGVLEFMDRASIENGGVTNANARQLILLQLVTKNPAICDIARTVLNNNGNDRKRKHG